MKRPEALRLIVSDQPHDRLRGARALGKEGRPGDVSLIQKALAKETVLWVRGALERAASTIESGNNSSVSLAVTDEATIDDATIRDIYLKASEEMVSELLHEVLPKLGYIRAAASKEIAEFDRSDTRKKIEYLEELLSLLAEFRKMSQTPKSGTFDLASLVDEVVEEVSGAFKGAITQKYGPRPLVVMGEPKRVRLAITNGLRNALEATAAVEDAKERFVTLTWGNDDERYWVSIVDQGVGIRGNINGMFGIGRTSKLHHFGMGLPLARQAMVALGGDATLAPGAQGGARFEVTWEKVQGLPLPEAS